MDAHARYVFDAFEKSGSGVSFVVNDVETAPSYMVTYGWSVNFGLPEFILFGDPMMRLDWQRIYRELIVATDTVPAIEDVQRWPIEYRGHPLVSVKVHRSNLAAGWFEEALFHRKRAGLSDEAPLTAHQLFWADRDGKFPWEEAGRHSITHRWLQPPLYEPDVRLGDTRPRKDSLRHRAEVLILCNPGL
jgi:hypothetical protein